MPTDSPATDPRPVEHFTPAIKACRDRLVDHVSRHLGVPIVGTPAPVTSVGPGDVAAAVYHLGLALEALDRDPSPPEGSHVAAARPLLEDVRRCLGAPAGVVLTSNVTPRQVLRARRQLHAAVDHLTHVLFNDPALDDQP